MTPKQIADFRKYEKVRLSGKYNMYTPQARASTGLSDERYFFVMRNYSELKELATAKDAKIRREA